MKYFFSFLILFSFHLSCVEQAPLTGKLISSAEDNWSPFVYLIQARSFDEIASSFTGAVIDSAEIQADGRFTFEKLPDAPESIFLELVVHKKGERFLNRLDNDNPLTSNYFPIVWKNGFQLNVSASITQFQTSFSITDPSPEYTALLELRDIRRKAFQEFIQHKNAGEHDETKILEEEAAKLSYQKPLMDFAEQTNYLIPALLAIRWVSPNNDYERIPEFLFSQCQKWKAQYPEHPWVIELCNKSKRENLPVLIGDKIENTSLPMLSGDTRSLYQIMGKKLTLLDLWASWCAPCRKQNKDFLVPLWEQYNAQGFEIVGYALDASEKAWQNAIEKDGANRWLHASHLQGDDAPFLEALRIQTIPANFLLDAEGKIIAKNLHGEELTEFVKQYMENN